MRWLMQVFLGSSLYACMIQISNFKESMGFDRGNTSNVLVTAEKPGWMGFKVHYLKLNMFIINLQLAFILFYFGGGGVACYC
ncbi:hypothetical protein VNO77_42940 [Canavalia gladiata]|uniref:Uncharacterized protein n=1 Tax=Canavalia gladiata TaxID=3824 RepID=A0AAN9JVZ2_CANGL